MTDQPDANANIDTPKDVSDVKPVGKPEISFADFLKLEIKIGTVVSLERVPDTDKLYQLQVNFGDHVRQIVSGIADRVTPEQLLGKQCPFVTNLAPRVIRGVESNGMIMAVGTDEAFALLHPHTEIPAGSGVR